MNSLLIDIFVFVIGAFFVAITLFSVVETVVLTRSVSNRVSRFVFVTIGSFLRLILKRVDSYETRDRVMAFYAPFALLALLPVWLTLILFGFMGMFWSLGVRSWTEAFKMSGSSLLTLGFSLPNSLPTLILSFVEATIGLMLVAVLIAYLPSMYASFSRREAAVTLLEVRAGNPPSALEMLLRFHRIHGFGQLTSLWLAWESWFAEIEESHTSLPALVFFRSPTSDHSWVTSAGAVLDAAALMLASVDVPRDPAAALCIRAGYLALRRIGNTFGISYNPAPRPDDPISVTQVEFNAAYAQLLANDVPMKADREQAWRDFSGWRVNYDSVLLNLAYLTMAPKAPWSSDRAVKFRRRKLLS